VQALKVCFGQVSTRPDYVIERGHG